MELELTRFRTKLWRKRRYTSRTLNCVDVLKYQDLHKRRNSFALEGYWDLSVFIGITAAVAVEIPNPNPKES